MLKPLLLGSLFLLCASSLFAAEYSGTVNWIYDGDTLLVTGIGKVRLLGVDTPEGQDSQRDRFYLKQFGIDSKRLRTVARQVKRFNIKTIKGVQVRLVTDSTDGPERDKYDRLLAYLYLPDGRMLNRILLKKGLASVFRRYQFSFKDDFLAAEKIARTAGIGLWQPLIPCSLPALSAKPAEKTAESL